jgi:hypothetical protein
MYQEIPDKPKGRSWATFRVGGAVARTEIGYFRPYFPISETSATTLVAANRSLHTLFLNVQFHFWSI